MPLQWCNDFWQRLKESAGKRGLEFAVTVVVPQSHEAVSRFGLAVRRYPGKQGYLGSILLRVSFLVFISCGLWTLSCDFVPHNK